jgi:3-hydroxyacyl-[acyl-carrier-protein] dehydratase
MLRNSFYTIVKRECSPGVVKALLSINRQHPILQGHFPGHPVVPGVCMMQMIKELMELTTNHSLRISNADNMKFLSVINPDQNNEVEAAISYVSEHGSFFLNASLMAGSTTFFKLKATLQSA